MAKFKKSYYDLIQKASVEFYEIDNIEEISYTDNQNKPRKKNQKTEKKVCLNAVATYRFNPAKLQFPSGHGRWVNSYFFRFWEVVLKDAGMFFLKMLDRYVHEQEKDHLFPTVPTICEDFDLTEYNVRKNLDILEKYNFIKRYRVYDTQSRTNLPSLIKIRKDIPLLPDDVLSGLSDKLQKEHAKYLQDISKPLNLLLGDKTEEIKEETTPNGEEKSAKEGGLNFTPPPSNENSNKIAGEKTNDPGLKFKPPSFEIQTRGGLNFKGRSINQYRSISQEKYIRQQHNMRVEPVDNGECCRRFNNYEDTMPDEKLVPQSEDVMQLAEIFEKELGVECSEAKDTAKSLLKHFKLEQIVEKIPCAVGQTFSKGLGAFLRAAVREKWPIPVKITARSSVNNISEEWKKISKDTKYKDIYMT